MDKVNSELDMAADAFGKVGPWMVKVNTYIDLFNKLIARVGALERELAALKAERHL